MKSIAQPGPLTHIYKTAQGCQIRADVYPSAHPNTPSSVILWLHGGALIWGSRVAPKAEHLRRYGELGCVVVAIDYRLAPETKLPGIIEDVRDAYRWVRETGPALFNIDPERVAVIGHSAGGYLSLMAGTFSSPPRALVSFYGYGDIVADWYTRPDPFYCQRPLISRTEALNAVGTAPTAEGTGSRISFYFYCRQQGLWPREVGGHDPVAERSFFLPFCPLYNISEDYPPTLLLHGDQDTDVPYEQSATMASALAAAGVDSELITIPGGGHGFDAQMDKPEVSGAFTSVLRFLEQHLACGS